MVCKLGSLEGRAESVPELGFERADAVEAAVLARVDAIARVAAGKSLVATPHLLAGAARREHHREPAHCAVGHRRVDPAALASPLDADQRAEDRGRRLEAASPYIGHLDRKRRRRSATLAVESKRARNRHVVEVVPRPRRKRTVLPIARDRAHDQARIALVKCVPTETEPGHDAGPVALDQHVGPVDQAQQQIATGVGFEIQRDASLVPVYGAEESALSGDDRRRPAHVVTGPRLLDLDDVRTHVSEEKGAVRTGQEPRQVKDADSR